jgi:hypothetical protein
MSESKPITVTGELVYVVDTGYWVLDDDVQGTPIAWTEDPETAPLGMQVTVTLQPERRDDGFFNVIHVQVVQ